jgi:hypothetical protein
MADPTVISDPIYQGEGKWFKFTLTRDDVVIDLDALSATFDFYVKSLLTDTVYVYEAPSEAFDLSNTATGIVRVNIPASVTEIMAVGTYYGQLVSVLVTDTDVDLSQLVKFRIKQGIL